MRAPGQHLISVAVPLQLTESYVQGPIEHNWEYNHAAGFKRQHLR